jgi:hypothetical protein
MVDHQGVDLSYIKGKHGSNVEEVSGKNSNNTDDLNKKITTKSAASGWTRKEADEDSSTSHQDPKKGAAENTSTINSNQNASNAGEKPNKDIKPPKIIHESSYKSTNAFAGEIHSGIGEEKSNLENQNNTNQWERDSELKQKESSVVKNQDNVTSKVSDKTEQGAAGNMATSLASNTVDSVKNASIGIKNIYNTTLGDPKSVKPFIKGDKHLVNTEDEDLKLNKDNKEGAGNSTEAKSSNANVSENQNNKSKSGD